ncbi:uncharacterized protein MELLADRAFT_92645 [Melampsora larici-populina 98AG31]|uniref:DNA polymerase epsilon subunit D n=1 Tax=Melampsora larici-populina (strain 98AG31 / pathotype 3-4-7) TaxID=747676 RepID=F4S2A3_MELLP|nr:uncharacterized protein MELLADRAFT_92645 [Melampsora larici-populina 98AG31]EGG01139.1 hypothetical protein MELLADRAFT_92645 [Melampsora larici-populina 98AG31]
MPKVKKIVQPPDVQQSIGGHQQAASFTGIEAVELPRAVVMKLAKSTGPGNMKLAKEVPVALTKASTVFINYLVSIAHGIAAERSEKSLGARHVLEACKELEWSDSEEMIRTLKTELEAFRKLNAAKKVEKASKPEPRTVPETTTNLIQESGSQNVEGSKQGVQEEEENEETEEEEIEDSMQIDENQVNINHHHQQQQQQSGSVASSDIMESDEEENQE